MADFEPMTNAGLSPGVVLSVGGASAKYLRLTHVFAECVYIMWVSTPHAARFARRPARMSRNDLEKLAAEPDSAWGRLALPGVLTDPPAEGSIGGENLKTAWALIEPLIRVFKKEAALSRFNFEALIRERAEATGSSFITLKRMLFRYYYFGGTRMALLPLPPGPKPGYQPYSNSEVDDREPPKRRGRQPVLASELGVNDFVVSENDVADMVECLEQCLRKGPTFITDAHEAYLSNHFRRRNGQIYTRYLDGKCVEPVTARQYRYYVSARALLIPETN